MKKQIQIIATALLLPACSFQLNKSGATVNKIDHQGIIENQFVFSGDQQLVKNYLNSMNVDATITPIANGVPAYQVKFKGNLPYEAIASGLEGQVDYVEPNYKVKVEANTDRYSWPNDRLFFKQWALNNIGQSPPFGLPGKEGADIDLLKAWATKTKGSKDVIVGVIDTGVDYTHPDLKANIWVNEKEAPENGGIPGKDDDGNGIIDDVHGFDFYSGGRDSNKFGIPGDNDPMDEDGHGTHCAGSIGAIANNAQGIVE